ncbi:archaetidylserine decarboxylase [Candidatus Thioglobus sp.]|jgi:phosphatidylserine decarboxylase|nr:archaetidylserine decarboxylase [Candidatus Thioglobus sp.]
MTFLQFLLPQHLLSRLMFRFARIQKSWIKNLFTSWFVSKYKVNLTEALLEDIDEYKHFNDFFTRALKDGSRPISDSKVVSPVDGVVSQFGSIKESMIVQAKGKEYSVEALLADNSINDLYTSFATIYLSPKDYHRIHMPFDGSLKSMKYIPGNLFSVNQRTVNDIDEVFARNERLVCFFDTEYGEIALVMVGAIFVGSMETSWEGQITPPYTKSIKTYDYDSRQIELSKGEELGRFNMGSTVILVLPKESPKLNLETGQVLNMGQSISD